MPAIALALRIRVLLVDDSRSFRRIARDLMELTGGFECVGEVSDGERAVEQAAVLQPDLVVMDVRMPGIGGVEAARRILARSSPPAVLLVSAADLPDPVPDGAMALAKEQLSPAALRRIRESFATV